MCQVGGPRCAYHARKALQSARERLRQAMAGNDPQRVQEARREASERLRTYYATPTGQRELRAQAEDEGLGEAERERAAELLREAEALRERQEARGIAYRQSLLLEDAYGDKLSEEERAQRDGLVARLAGARRDMAVNGFTRQALDSDLAWEGEAPDWLWEDEEESLAMYGTAPEIVDVLEVEGRELAVVWEEHSLGEDDVQAQGAGYNVSRICYRDMETGDEVGYVSAMRSSEEALERTYGDGEYADALLAADKDGLELGEDLSLLMRSEENEREVKRGLWLSAYSSGWAEEESASMREKGLRGWRIGEEDIPEDEKVLDAELAPVLGQAGRVRERELRRYENPYVEYASLREEYRGRGLGASLYVYLGRKLGEDGLLLAGSQEQSEDAQGLWGRMLGQGEIPLRVVVSTEDDGESYGSAFAVDFRGR